MNLKKLLVLTGLTACCAAGAAAETAAPLTEPLTAAEASSVGNVGAIEKVSPPKRFWPPGPTSTPATKSAGRR